MVIELDAGRWRRSAQNSFTWNGPNAFFGALLDEDETVARYAQQTVGLPDRSSAAAKVIHRHLPTNGTRLDVVWKEFRFESLLFPAAECQDWKFRATV